MNQFNGFSERVSLSWNCGISDKYFSYFQPGLVDRMGRIKVETATEAVRVVTSLLTRPDEVNRHGRAQRAALDARAAAKAVRTLANAVNSEERMRNAAIAESLASTAEALLTLVPLN